MFRLRQEQIEVLRAQMRLMFVSRMVEFLQGYYPDELEKQLGDEAWGEATEEYVRQGIEKAASYKISSENDVAGFLELMVLTDREFDQKPDYRWAKRILTDPKLPTTGKIELIREQLKIRARKNPEGAVAHRTR